MPLHMGTQAFPHLCIFGMMETRKTVGFVQRRGQFAKMPEQNMASAGIGDREGVDDEMHDKGRIHGNKQV